MHVLGVDYNKYVYYSPTYSVISTENKLTMDGLVTKVLVIGKEDEEGHVPIEDFVDNNSDLGVWQDILIRDSTRTIEEIKQEAEVYLDQ